MAPPTERTATIGVYDRPANADRNARLVKIGVVVAIAAVASAASFAWFWYFGAV
jgi:hypothetical protein